MNTEKLIKDKKQFEQTAKKFFNNLFGEALKTDCGEIEISGFKDGPRHQSYHSSTEKAVDVAYKLCQTGLDVYFGVNLRVGGAGKKDNIHWLTAFHVEIDYGSDGHKKKPEYETYEQAFEAITKCQLQPTYVNHSGGGFHCYWVLNEPVNVSKIDIEPLENVNRVLTAKLKGDSGTHNINRILRVPETFNLKLLDNPREVTVIFDDGPKYDFKVFKPLLNFKEKPRVKKKVTSAKPLQLSLEQGSWEQKISSLKVSDRIKFLIKNGNDGTYASRSEADQAVITALVNKGMDELDIKQIFENYRIGEKYREHKGQDEYLQYCIRSAEKFSNLTEEERQDPVFISGALHKTDNGKYHLKIVQFQEYMNKKHMLKYLEKERAFFRYNDECYEQCNEERLNYLCQRELGKHRDLFTKTVLSNFIHHSIADDLVYAEKAYEDQVRYLTMQNGLYDLIEHQLIPHTPDIFTTNLLPYEYDPNAQCPRFKQYLNEVFLSDKDMIKVVQESIGYAFHKAIPKPALFFLVGNGSNGKSVFIDILSYLCGKENVANISLNLLSSEVYILDLFGKMINVSSETPSKRNINTDLVKAVVAGDWVTGRELYKRPSKFKPFAKHYLAMNELPNIDDNTHGMWRRLYVIEFPRKFTENEMDVELTYKLKNELSGIFNWALEGYKRLRDQKFIFSKSQSMRKMKKEYKNESSSVLDFISRCLRKSEPEDSASFKKIYDLYKMFCENEGYKKPYPKKDFKSTLGNEDYKVDNSSKHANQLRIFGVKYKAISE